MKDPRRLLEDAALSDVERRSLTAARAVEPPPELASEVWTDLVIAAGAAGAASSAAATAASASAKANATTAAGAGGAKAGAVSGASLSASAGAKVAVIKALALGATLGAITTGAVALTSPPRHLPEASVAPSAGAAAADRSSVSRSRQRDVVAPAALSSASESATPKATGTDTTAGMRPRDVAHSEPAPSNEGIVAPSGLHPGRDEQAPPGGSATATFDGVGTKVPGANEDAQTARAEARLVGVAREALQHGDPGRALVVLEDTQRRFPDGILLREREALSISALAAVGRKAEAASRASIFLRAFPNSPHAERVLAALRAH
jgi:hypothetical protein